MPKMKRREFLQSAAIAGSSSCTSTADGQIVVAEARRDALDLLAGFPHGALDRPWGELAVAPNRSVTSRDGRRR